MHLCQVRAKKIAQHYTLPVFPNLAEKNDGSPSQALFLFGDIYQLHLHRLYLIAQPPDIDD